MINKKLEALCEKWIGELDGETIPASRITAIDALIRLTDFANSFYEQANDKVDYEGLANRVAEILVEKAIELPAEDQLEGLDPSAAYMEAAVTRDDAKACGTPIFTPPDTAAKEATEEQEGKTVMVYYDSRYLIGRHVVNGSPMLEGSKTVFAPERTICVDGDGGNVNVFWEKEGQIVLSIFYKGREVSRYARRDRWSILVPTLSEIRTGLKPKEFLAARR